ncbi:MAG TPA: efflux RND transporter periplasmic adaptor subunit [Burkholderiales bacterium]
MKKIILALSVFAASLAGCGKPEEKAALPPPRVENGAVIFDRASPQLAQLRTALAEPLRESVVRLSGRLIWNEDRTARIFTPLAGKVLAIHVKPGDRVKQGQALADFAAPDLGVAQSEARKAEQDYALAEKTLARVEELHAAGVSPTKELQAAQADAARAASERARTQARLKGWGLDARNVDQRFALRTPLSGVVVERNLNPGQEVRPDAAPPAGIFVVSDPEHLWFVLDASETSLAALQPGQQVELAASALGEDRVTGRITHVADLVDPQTRTVKVRGTVDNPDHRLKAEMYVTAIIRLPGGHGLLIPTSAIYLRGEQHFVFVDAGDGRYVRRAVKVGPVYDEHQVVLQGLEPGAKVVTDGNLLLEKIFAEKD